MVNININDLELFKIYLKIDIQRLYTDSVTNKDHELIDNYIDTLSKEESEIFRQLYHDCKYNRKKCNITHNSIKLTLKLYNDTGEKTFPFINKIACKGWSIGEGTFSFSLYLLNNEFSKEIFSWHRVSDCLLKRYKINTQPVYGSIGHIEIILTEDKEVTEDV